MSVKLEVRDNSGEWSSTTTVYTIQEHKGRKYFLTDHLGNVRTTVNRDGNVLGYDDYYAFGLSMPGSHSSNTSNPNDTYKFTGHERDDEAGLTIDYMNARTYDPVIGRFMQVDPLSDQFPGWTPCHYVHNNPLKLTDPTGMMACDPPKTKCGLMDRIASWFSRPASQRQEDFGGHQKQAIVQNRAVFDQAEQTVATIQSQAQEQVAGVVETVVKEGPEVLDVVSESSSQAAVAFGSVAVMTGGPTTPDDIAWGTAATITGATGAISNIAATVLSVVDANYYGGDQTEANIRVRMTAISISTQGVAGLFFAGQMTNAVLNAGKSSVIIGAATATTVKVTTEAVEDINDMNQ